MPSIRDLPTELLIDLFEKYSWIVPLGPLTLSFVCHMWHDIVYTSPRVWQFILLQDVCEHKVSTVEKLQRQASLWLANSSPLPFDVAVDFQVHSQEQLFAIISILIGGLDRWGGYTFIRGKCRETVDVSRIVLAPSAYSDSSDEDSDDEEQGGRLKLRVGTATVDQLEVQVDEGVVLRHQSEEDDLKGKLPTFRRVHAGPMTLTYPVPHLPFPSQINPMGITVLSITEMEEQSPLNPVQLLRFLAAFPEIKTLIFYGSAQQPEYDVADVPSVVTLPKLRGLTVGGTWSIRTILSHLVVPELTHLYLQRLNIEFTIPNQQIGEDGDSDDEAHDYSQSPSSDHATGMGLRMLQRRSNPPLQVLDMDYADLRTKDFLFCFNRFPLLREFRIVASDMSDKVIEMLVPHNDLNGRREIRLPFLKELELRQCQRVTGRAIVNALRERVSFVGRSPMHARMDYVRVVDCANVFPEHNLGLFDIFGSRFSASN